MTSNSNSSVRTRAGVLLAVLLGLVLAACGATPAPAATDPYVILGKALDQDYDPIKLQLGVKVTGATTGNITIEPSAIEVVVDTKAGAGSLKLALPVEALGEQGASLGMLGITGDTLDVELLVAGEALYARSPIFPTVLPLLAAQLGAGSVDGDLSGWLQLGTAADLEALGGMVGELPSAAPSAPALSFADAVKLKSDLEAAGVTLAFVGVEARDGADAQHLSVTVDWAKLAASDIAKQLPADQLDQIESMAGSGDVKVDAWVDPGSGRLREVQVEATEGSEGGQFRFLLSDPGSVSLAAPADFTEVPLVEMLAPMLQMFGGSLMP